MFARPGLPRFDYMRPATRGEVVRLLAKHGAEARLLMGGTDLLPRLRDGLLRPSVVIDLKALPGMREILYDPQSGLSVGAAVPLNALAEHPAVQVHYPLLAQAASSVASYQVRNRATLGGNLCNASPAADTAPAVLVLAGRAVLFGLEGEREVPADHFFLGPGQTAMRGQEYLVAVRFPIPPRGAQGTYLKLGRSKAGDLAIAGAAVYGFPDGDSVSGFHFRIALASVAPIPLRVRVAEEVLKLYPAGEGTFLLAASEAAESARPIDDVRASASYRKAMVRVLTLRALHQVSEAMQGASGQAAG